MINDLKLGIKSLRFAHGRIANSIGGLVLFVSGLGVLIAGAKSTVTAFFGGYFLMCAGMFLTQMIYSLNVTGLVQSSPAKKKLQTSVPAVVSFTSMVLIYLIIILIRGLTVLQYPQMTNEVCSSLIIHALVMVVVMVYEAVAYKYFFMSIVMFFFIYFSIYSMEEGLSHLLDFSAWGILGSGSAFFAAVAIGMLILVLGGLAQYLISLLVYRVPLSKMAQTATLRKEM